MRVRKITESKKLREQSDGWDLEDNFNLNSIMTEISRLKYELDNCARGAYTGCKTYRDLGEYIVNIADRLEDIGWQLQDDY